MSNNQTIAKMRSIQFSKNPRWVPHGRWGAERLYYLSHFLIQKGFRKIAYVIKYINLLIFRTYIPPEVKIGKRLDLPHGGFGVVIQKDTTIGDDAIIFHNVTFGNGGARVGDRVYIGTGATILGNVRIGDDVTIGANTLINFDVPDGSTVVGQVGSILKK